MPSVENAPQGSNGKPQEKSSSPQLEERRRFEDRIKSVFGQKEPPPWSPTRGDEVETTLVGGVSAISDRQERGREVTVASLRVTHCRQALQVALEARDQGTELIGGFSVETLTTRLQKLEEAEKQAQQAYAQADHELCMRNYGAWRVVNK